jgi:MIP family channel proteins
MLDFENPPAAGLLQRTAAEMVGTFAMVFAGCGAIMVEHSGGALGHLGVCAVFGLVVGAMIFSTGHISGAHFNPAVTIAFASIKRFPWREVPAFIGGQIAAATIAALALLFLVGDQASMGATTFSIPPERAFGIEVILTGFLMFVITAVATDRRAPSGHAAVAIGATVALCALMGGPLTGASMNPARSLGPAMVAGIGQGQWLYMSAPIIGALAGAWAYVLIAFRR